MTIEYGTKEKESRLMSALFFDARKEIKYESL